MAISGSAYALPNPGMIDPYPIESVLAKDTSSPLTTLMAYRADRDLAGQNYQHELEAQHQQVRAQLIATMQNNAAERLVGAMPHAGGVNLLTAADPWVLGGARPDIGNVLSQYNTPDQIKQMGEAAKPGSETAKNLGEAGFIQPQGMCRTSQD